MLKPVEVQNILRLSARQIADLLQRLNDGTHAVTVERRQTSRIPYHGPARLCVLLENEPKGRRTYAPVPRNLAQGGISLLHGKFVYGGTNCMVGLHSLEGQVVPSRGKVIWCRLITGHVHELGIQFDELIDLAEFVQSPS